MVTRGISGTEIGSQLQRKAKRTRADAGQRTADMKRLEERADELVAKRGERFLELARHYLPALSQEHIAKSFAGIRDELLAVHSEQEREVEKLVTRMASVREEHIQQEQLLEETTTRLDDKVADRERLEKEVADHLRSDAEFQELSNKALYAEEVLARNEDRAEEIRLEAAAKLPAYESSRLFQYLIDRDFGTTSYEGRGLTRRLDRWVSRLIGFRNARRSYEFLRVTPRVVAAEVERRRTEFSTLMERIETMEDDAADTQGLTALLREGEELGAERDRIVEGLDAHHADYSRMERKLDELQRSKGKFYEDAIDRFRRFLEDAESATLETKASRTQEKADDRLVSEITWLTKEIDSLRGRFDAATSERHEIEERASAVERVLTKYRKAGFDGHRSFFEPGFDARRALKEFFDGRSDEDALWEQLRQNQTFEPSWVESKNIGSVLSSDMSRVLIGAMTQVAGSLLQGQVGRGVRRRDSAVTKRRARQGRPRMGGGFTSGGGF